MRPRNDRPALTKAAALAAGALLALCAGPAAAGPTGRIYRNPPGSSDREPTTRPTETLKVCADPNNLPFSNRQQQGFENKLASLVADALGEKLSYYWWPQRRAFARMTLYAGKCDVVMGTPASDMMLTTRPYYTSTYVFVSRKDRDLTFTSLAAPELRHLRIGVHLIGDDGSNTPPAYVLGSEHIVDNVVGYMIYGDYAKDNPPGDIVKAVERGDIDVAAVWGPLAGYYARTSPVPLRVVPISDTMNYFPLVFRFSISMGVRLTDSPLRDRLDEVLLSRREEIRSLLAAYGVPQL